MKRFVVSLAVLAVAAMPLTAMAATLAAGEQYSLPAQKVVIGNLYAVAGTTTLGGQVTGDVLTAGGTIALSGAVGGDILALGGTIQVLGPVGGDVRAAGGTLTVNDRVGGDVVVAGGTLHVLPGAVVQGDLIVAAGQAIVDGSVMGSIRMVGGTLTINGTVGGNVYARADQQVTVGGTAKIRGNFAYRSQKSALIEDGAFIGGDTTYTALNKVSIDQKAPERIMWAIVGVLTGMALLAALGLAALLMWRWRRQSLEVLSQAKDAFWSSLGQGVAYGILVPIAIVLLLVSFVGSLAGVLLLLVYVAAWVLTKALAGMLFGSWLVMLFKKRQVMHLTWWSSLGGVLLLKIVGLVPVVGPIVSMAASLVVFGVMSRRVHQMLAAR